ncbi:Fantom protein [Quillaja saponaria]|uniref:Fantom protein n=1 Tax=Quillaja saponaria TaxID=32244 RepID=A0AAD7PS98_QUISA|nr:Fantom protein [Quillaja saponaria]
MLCSAPAGKSSSKWLDRLRSNKGIPTGDNLDLDYFLKNQSNPLAASNSVHSTSESTQLDQKRVSNENQPLEISSSSGDKQWVGVMGNVLCELFNMCDDQSKSSNFSRTKCPRKQGNPKFCVISTSKNNIEDKSGDFARKDENVQATNSLNNDMMEMKEATVECEDVEDEKGDKELLGYSRSEVTVIDTSCPIWKFEKLVFRKKNVWKVREKKGKSKFFGKKKRKWSSGSDKNSCGNKKAKLLGSEFMSSKDGKEVLQPLSEERSNEQNSIHETREEVHKDTRTEKRYSYEQEK